MRVIIPAAGTGSRLRPYTEEAPKALVPVAGTPLIWHTMRRLAKVKVSEVVVVCGYRSEMLRSSLHACPEAPPLRLVENPDFATTNSIVSLALTRPFWDEPFCVIDGDVLVGRDLLQRMVDSPRDVLAVDTSKAYADIDMKVRIQDGRAVDFGKDLEPSPRQGEFFGVSRWSGANAARFSSAIDEMLAAGRVGDWYEFAMRKLAITHGLDVLHATSDEWAEVDSAQDVPVAAALVERDEVNFP
ncbi:phosphocholine cytidylyltransferase family protein [Streptomyces sp. NBC_00878]|uniref:phosphocholine cytidylyltransferase family protein n=1 Tax=Streptomyces sp. NBC_00878 TaxID=2975854 RepID=UPI00224E1C27|nr:phosphocholine cytidylyltransferase family protein [Streptomyces sp. NBC_00878]MCX4902779.1 phosphocholine cytidylyltransferase family protein [Streptomyces sp. NBC_00878]